ncbi:MAG: hypothetical protein EAZ55_07480 [Cytophagales bacterium]|nr:MAG: hypothetical protein EAZ55_07480 [Cytophagales bacterium]
MEKKELKYYLGCGIFHKTYYHFYDYIEDIEIEDMQTRLEQTETRLSNMGWWFVHQTERLGYIFVIDDEKVLIYDCVINFATKVHTFYHSINELKQMEDFDEKISSFYLYYLE